MFDFDKLSAAISGLEEDDLFEMLNELKDQGPEAAAAALQACQKGMDEVGRLYEEGEYFVGDLIYAGELMTDTVNLLKDSLVSDGAAGPKTKMIMCTVKEDLHDIGKNIVKVMMEANGFEVVDLGVDTPVQKVVDTAREQDIHIVALSGVLTLALDSMKDTVAALKAAGLNCKVIIGGAPVSEDACRYTGADEWALSPQKTVNVCKAWAAE